MVSVISGFTAQIQGSDPGHPEVFAQSYPFYQATRSHKVTDSNVL